MTSHQRIDTLKQKWKFEPYWYLITLFLAIAGIVFIYHLATDQTPSRVAFSLGTGFQVYWYGICIVSGIALGAYVVSRLANERGTAVFNQEVPASSQQTTLNALKLPRKITQSLSRRKITNLGQLLLLYGYNPKGFGLQKEDNHVTQKRLLNTPGIKKSWVTNAPWRIWNPDYVWNGLILVLLLGVIGARLYHVLTPSPSMAAYGIESALDYFRNPAQLINVRNGGLGIYGGILGGLVGLFIYARRVRIPLLAWADLAVVGLALGQVFGRWGNFFNQELYGRPSNLPWAITIEPRYRLPAYSEFSHFHPAFLYESLWNLLTFFVLYWLVKCYTNKLLTGEVMALYLIFYAIGRILLEFIRLDSRIINLGVIQLDLAIATFISTLIAISMAAWIVFRRWHIRN
ncbi:MAG: prolipoprotein diacylglyceryl transferase [Anaerolineales bacterium]|nr:prolipoprotein diacylglyceryl transferase [Anaerolineales bacterium]